jgi:Helicase HerA, central domain
MASLFLGETVDPAAHARTGTRIELDPASFTTHGVIVGQTGSGKTGLGMVLIEEALRAGIPTLLIDPKGDLGNLDLLFPDLKTEDFTPWVEGADPAQVATQWKEGLAGWGLDGAAIGDLKTKSEITIYTPGSSAGVGLNLIGSLQAPADAMEDAESRVDEVGTVVSGLLGLMSIEADPLTSREHILLTNLIDRAWASGATLDLAGLVSQVQQPPMRKLGVIDLDSFYPPKDRMELAMKLNGLLASPSFGAWGEGVNLDIESLLHTADGRPRAAILTLGHLSDEERQFVITLVLGRLISWMRKQAGTSQLRALVYFDEVFGFVPPTAAPPTKKPILTLLKQARAFGVGLVLATQNPVDVDYKALSNATTWIVGRLQTERDRDRLLDGMRSAAGGVNIDELSATISGLAKREFVLHRSGVTKPEVFTSRWSLCYLRGPLTREQISTLMTTQKAGAATLAAAATSSSAAAGGGTAAAPVTLDDNEVPVAPPIAKGTTAYFLDAAAPWADQVGAVAGGTRHKAYLAARVSLLFDDEKADLREESEWEAVFPLDAAFAPDSAITVDYDARDFLAEPPAGASFVLPQAPVADAAFFTNAKKALADHLVASHTVSIQRNEALKLWARPGESDADFLARCDVAAQAAADAETEKIRTALTAKITTIQAAVDEAQRREEEVKAQVRATRASDLLSVGTSILGAFLGGRKNTRSIARSIGSAASRTARATSGGTKVDNAGERVAAKAENLEALQAQLQQELTDIDAKWDEVGRTVTTAEIPLEKTDVRVTELAVVWVPQAR